MLNPIDVPSLETVFGIEKPLMRSFERAKIFDIIPAMIIPEGEFTSVAGISLATDRRITHHLRSFEIDRRLSHAKLQPYLSYQFGAVKNTPISALQVAIVRDGNGSFPVHAPLELITFLNVMQEHLLLADIVAMGYDGLMEFIRTKGSLEIFADTPVRNAREDLKHILWRLDNLDLKIEGYKNPNAGFQLQAVV